jgi:hypothetical protein
MDSRSAAERRRFWSTTFSKGSIILPSTNAAPPASDLVGAYRIGHGRTDFFNQYGTAGFDSRSAMVSLASAIALAAFGSACPNFRSRPNRVRQASESQKRLSSHPALNGC